MIKSTDFFSRKRKDMVFMARMFSYQTDGPYDDRNHRSHTKLDRSFVRNRIDDAMIAATGCSGFISKAFVLNDNYYVAYAHVKKNSKKADVLKSFGFVETKVG